MNEIKNRPGTISVRWWEVHYGEETKYRVCLYNENKVVKERVVNNLAEAQSNALDMYDRFTTVMGNLATPDFFKHNKKSNESV